MAFITGMTLDKVILNLSNREFANGLTYTAVTRVRKLSDIAFKPFPNYLRIKSIFNVVAFRQRQQEELRKKNLASDHKEFLINK